MNRSDKIRLHIARLNGAEFTAADIVSAIERRRIAKEENRRTQCALRLHAALDAITRHNRGPAMRKRIPRPHTNPLDLLARRAPLADDQQRDIAIAYHASLNSMLTGYGTEQAWSTVACALNVSLLLAECNICAPALQTIQLAQEALLRSRERAGRTGKWALDGDGIRVVQAALNIHDKQNSRATRGQITEAIREVHRRVSDGEVFNAKVS